MLSWKETLKEKLIHLLSDSSSSSSTPDPDQTRSNFTDGSYLSSILAFFLSSNESSSHKHGNDLKPTQSLPTSNLKSVRCENLETSNTREENGDQGSGRSTSSSDVFEDATDLQTPKKHDPNFTLGSLFISSELFQFFQSCLPNIVKGCRWVLLYSTMKHGISLRTLIRKSSDLSGPCLLITGDTKGAVFGGLLNCPLTPSPKWKYQGTCQTFVFTTLYGAPTLFRPTGANRYFYMCLNEMLAFGGGGNFALCLDGDLLTGTSGPCDTFGNQCLAHNEEFELKNVELWGFTHSSRWCS